MTVVYYRTAGRCCLYRAKVRGNLPICSDPMHCWARPGVHYHCKSIQLTISGTTSRCQWTCHQLLLNALACSVLWSPPYVIHHWWCRLDGLHWESSNLGCPWAPTPHVHLPTQKQVLGSFYRDDAVKASTCLHETRLACGSGSFSLGTYDAPTSYNLSKFIDIRPLLRDAHFCLRGQRVANH